MKYYEKILFEKNINNLKNKTLKNFFLEFFLLKNILIKLISLFVITLVCGLMFFLIRHYSLIDNWNNVVFNKGIAWGIGDDWPVWLGYFIKVLPCIVLIFLIFLTHEWYLQIPLNIIFINALFNVIDKALVDTYNEVEYFNSVVDNISWHAFKFTNNVADIFIIVGCINVIISYMYMIFLWYKNRKQDNENKQEDNSQSTKK